MPFASLTQTERTSSAVKRSRWPTALAAAAYLLSALMLAGDALPGERPKDIGHLFRVSRAGLADSYVFGTIHIADARVAAVPQPVLDALARTHTLAVELVPERVDARAAELELLDGRTSLASLLPAAEFTQLQSALHDQGIAADVIARLKPWAAMMKIGRAPESAAAAAAAPSLDTELYVEARRRGMKILPLELLEEQVAAFDTIPMASQLALLTHAIRHRAALAATIEPTIHAWQRGEFRMLEGVAGVAYDQYPGMGEHRSQLMKNIIENRTVLMHHRLFSPLRAGRVFVAIGAMHLPGPRGLLAALRADGYQITPVW
jgi:uncharacterized protein YbaP (TraB family)